MSKKLKVAMIGSGFIARAHSNAFRQVGRFFKVAYELGLKVICARDRAKLEAMAAKWGWEETETDWHKVVSRADIDVVDIAVPNDLHAPIAAAAAAAGKMVWCEKPLAMSLEEGERMAQAVGEAPNLVWFNFRRVPAVVYAKQLIAEGRLGQIFHYRGLYLNQSGNDPTKAAGWRYRRAEAGSGAAGDLLSHSIDMALYLNGAIKEVTAMAQTFAPGRDVDDATLFLARFANGSIGSFEGTRYGVGCRNRNSLEIHGSRGMLGFDLDEMNYLEFVDATEPPSMQGPRKIMVTGPDHPYSENFWKPGHIIGYEHSFIATLGDFLGCLEAGEPFHPNFDDGVAVQRVLDSAERSAASGAWVTVDPPSAEAKKLAPCGPATPG
jgi:predicted dehydrogenase